MAIYLYKCEKHGEFEIEHSMQDKLTECPKCKENGKSEPIVRLIYGGTNFILRGSCWAKDNYK